MSDFTLADFTVGMRVTIDRVPSTMSYHFIPSAPGNTATVVLLDEDRNNVVVDLDDVKDGMAAQRSEEDAIQNALNRKNWVFSPSELLISDSLAVSE